MMAGALELTCPACGVNIVQIVNGDLDTARDSPYICVACRALMVLDMGGNESDVVERGLRPALRRPTWDEEGRFLRDPRVIHAITTVGEYHAENGPPMTERPDGEAGSP